jgi:ParB-like chromosome segregation protein Spo0J
VKPEKSCRFCMVATRQIKRIPGIKNAAAKSLVQKTRAFAEQRGFFMPVILSEAGGLMTLLSGAATFEACLEERIPKVPAIVVKTDGDSDELMFSLQSAELSAPPDAMFISAAVIRLIDAYAVSRRTIAESLGKSPAWISRMEGLRRLSTSVWELVSDGFISSRAAQEIARLPADVQMPFAASVGNEYLNKDDIARLINRYLDDNTGAEERDRIIRSPKQSLPEPRRGQRKGNIDQSISSRLPHAMTRCFDCTSYLLNLLNCGDTKQTAINASDAATLASTLSALANQLQNMLCPGGNEADGND